MAQQYQFVIFVANARTYSWRQQKVKS